VSQRLDYRRFDGYEDFIDFCNQVKPNWLLHSWQDVGGREGIDIRAIFSQDASTFTNALPQVKS